MTSHFNGQKCLLELRVIRIIIVSARLKFMRIDSLFFQESKWLFVLQRNYFIICKQEISLKKHKHVKIECENIKMGNILM